MLCGKLENLLLIEFPCKLQAIHLPPLNYLFLTAVLKRFNEIIYVNIFCEV